MPTANKKRAYQLTRRNIDKGRQFAEETLRTVLNLTADQATRIVNQIIDEKSSLAREMKTWRWATIGGRIEEYADTYWIEGEKAARREILQDYGSQNFKHVWNGLRVFVEFGADGYYSRGRITYIAENGF